MKKTILVIIMIMISVIAVPENAHADAVTDNISVAVGYTGMELKEYVTVGDYHWADLMNELPVYEQAYSYYQSGNGPKFTEIVDAGRGFLLTDLLEYANVYYSDILNLQFYVVDHQGIQAKFDRNVLFAERYYFEDYNGHLYREYDDDFNLKSVDSRDCWNHKQEVSPMLALEDNWVAFTEEFDHSLPDFEHANPSTRFRLLFGQTHPEETLTSSSAKYVRTVYITLQGKPEFDDDFAEKEIDGSYGSHEIDTTVRVKGDMRDSLKDLINFSSTDERVLVIDGIDMVKDDFYEDLMHIKIKYRIVGEGTASIAASFGSTGEKISGTAVVAGESDPGGGEEADPGGGGDQPSGDTDPDSGNKQSDGSGQKDKGSNNSEGSGQSSGGSSGSGRANSGTAAKKNSRTATTNKSKQARAEKKTEAISNSSSAGTSGTAMAFMLSDDVKKKLNGSKGDSAPTPFAPENEKVTEVKMEDKTEEEKERARLILILTGVGSTALAGIGALSESISFSFRLKKGL